MKKTTSTILYLCLLQASAVFADSDTRLEHYLSLSLEDLMNQEVTISTATRQTLGKAPSVVTVITEDDIKATGATNLVDVLEGVPGVHIRANHFAFRPLIQFRGANATQTLLMVNGVPLRDLMWGFGIFWKGLPVSMIDRVEIIRGPGSALFGSDASAGVINVITKTAGTIEDAEVGVRAGSFDTNTVWAQYGGLWRGHQVNMTAEVFGTDGHSPYISADRQTADDASVSYAPDNADYGWRNQDFHLSVARSNVRLLADYMHQSDLETGMTGAGVLDPVTEGSSTRYNIDLLYDNAKFRENWGLNAELRYYHLEYDSGDGFQERPPGYSNGTDTYPIGMINQMRSAERRTSMELSGQYSGFTDHAIRLGAGITVHDLYRVEQIVNSSSDTSQLVDVSDTAAAFAPENDRTVTHLYVQDVWSIADDLELTAGARYDDYSDFGDTVNPRLALVWKSSDKLTTKIMYGESFRAPSYRELYASTSYAEPNPNLDPEQSETIDLAFSYTATRDLQLNLNLFKFHQRELISRNKTTGQYENTGEHTVDGAEVEALWQAARNLKVAANYTYLNPDEDSATHTFDEPEHDAYLRMDWGFSPSWNWNLQANWIGERERSASDTRPAADDYTITDTTLRYAGIKDWEFSASIRNLFDVDARAATSASIPDDLPLPERSFYAELRYQF